MADTDSSGESPEQAPQAPAPPQIIVDNAAVLALEDVSQQLGKALGEVATLKQRNEQLVNYAGLLQHKVNLLEAAQADGPGHPDDKVTSPPAAPEESEPEDPRVSPTVDSPDH